MSNNRGRFDIFEIVVISLLLPISVGVIVNIITPKILSPDKNQNPGPQVQNPPAVTPTPTYTPTPIPSPPVYVPPRTPGKKPHLSPSVGGTGFWDWPVVRAGWVLVFGNVGVLGFLWLYDLSLKERRRREREREEREWMERKRREVLRRQRETIEKINEIEGLK